MINSTSTINIDGANFKQADFKKAFTIDNNDTFGRWVVRPLALLAAVGVGVAVFFASAFIVIVSLALLPLLAVAMWAMRTKLKRDLADSETVINLGAEESETLDPNRQAAS